MPTVLITPEKLLDVDGPHIAPLREAGFDVRYPRNREFTRGLCSEGETIDELSCATALLAGGEVLSAPVLAALPDLRVIARCGVGYDRVDVPAATARSVVVTITPTANHEAVAEHAFALLFAVAKRIVVHDKATRSGTWSRNLTAPIRGTTFGVFGLGRIGRSAAVRAAALGMKVVACDPVVDATVARALGVELVDFDTLLATSDYLSIHCPLNDKTTGLFDRGVFSRMKPGSTIINTARGPIIIEADLVAALENGPLGFAGLDVFEEEPTTADNRLFQLDNVVVSPHLAGCDTLGMEDMGIEAADCIVKLHRGEWPEGAVVNDELRGTWSW